MKYTKGDWKVEYYNHEDDEGYMILAQEAPNALGLIADCPPHTDNPKTGLANANLIAAAPNCYEELVHADELICQLCVRLNPQHENCTSCQERDSRLQALAKAEGKEV